MKWTKVLAEILRVLLAILGGAAGGAFMGL